LLDDPMTVDVTGFVISNIQLKKEVFTTEIGQNIVRLNRSSQCV